MPALAEELVARGIDLWLELEDEGQRDEALQLLMRWLAGEQLTERADENELRLNAAEDALRAEGFRELRVRYHDRVARIELPLAEAGRLLEAPRRERIVRTLRDIGFDFVALDLQGFRSGSLNDVLGRRKHEGPGD